MSEKENNKKEKKAKKVKPPLTKRWTFWVLVVFVSFAAFGLITGRMGMDFNVHHGDIADTLVAEISNIMVA